MANDLPGDYDRGRQFEEPPLEDTRPAPRQYGGSTDPGTPCPTCGELMWTRPELQRFHRCSGRDPQPPPARGGELGRDGLAQAEPAGPIVDGAAPARDAGERGVHGGDDEQGKLDPGLATADLLAMMTDSRDSWRSIALLALRRLDAASGAEPNPPAASPLLEDGLADGVEVEAEPITHAVEGERPGVVDIGVEQVGAGVLEPRLAARMLGAAVHPVFAQGFLEDCNRQMVDQLERSRALEGGAGIEGIRGVAAPCIPHENTPHVSQVACETASPKSDAEKPVCGQCIRGDHYPKFCPDWCACDCEIGVCARCSVLRDHARCEGRTEPDADLVGDHYQQTNRCACEACEEYERERTRWNRPPYDIAQGDDWAAHIATLAAQGLTRKDDEHAE